MIDAEAKPTFPAASETCAITVFSPSAPPRVTARVPAYGSNARPRRAAVGREAHLHRTDRIGEARPTVTLPVVVAAAPPSMTIEPVGAVVSTTVTRKVCVEVLPAASVAVTVTVVVPSAKVVPGRLRMTVTSAPTASHGARA